MAARENKTSKFNSYSPSDIVDILVTQYSEHDFEFFTRSDWNGFVISYPSMVAGYDLKFSLNSACEFFSNDGFPISFPEWFTKRYSFHEKSNLFPDPSFEVLILGYWESGSNYFLDLNSEMLSRNMGYDVKLNVYGHISRR